MTRKFPPSVGGMENFAYDLYQAINKKTQTYLVKWGGKNILLPLIIPYLAARSLWTLVTKKVDIIHVQDVVLAPLGWILKLLFKKPLVVIVHGLDITFDNKIYQAIWPRFVAKADKVICISRAARDEAVARGIPGEKAVAIPLGSKFKTPSMDKKEAQEFIKKEFSIETEKRDIIFSVGRLVKRKGVLWFIENVMPGLVESNKNVLFVVAGDGEERQKIQAAVTSNKLENHVQLLGRVSDKALEALFLSSNVFVMPNIKVANDMEGFGIVLVEAASYGLPIVASGIEGILDATKNNKNALHAEERNADEFSEKVLRFLRSEEDAEKFGLRAKRYTKENYSWENIANEYIDVYSEISLN